MRIYSSDRAASLECGMGAYFKLSPFSEGSIFVFLSTKLFLVGKRFTFDVVSRDTTNGATGRTGRER